MVEETGGGAMHELERLQRKLEQGEPLSPDELGFLERSARSEPSVLLRLCLAWAWLNDGREKEALESLRRLHRVYPVDGRVARALARTYATLGRSFEAETTLLASLRQDPGATETLRALAALLLRRGELRRAQGFCSQALRIDPFDGESQRLGLELERAAEAAAELGETLDYEGFVDALAERLKEQGVRHRIRRDGLVAAVGKRVVRFDLRALHRSYEQDPSAGAELYLNELVQELRAQALALPATRSELLEQVLPVLRPPGFEADSRALGALHREGPAALWIYYVLSVHEPRAATLAGPSEVRYLPERLLRSQGLSLSEVDDRAWSNLSDALTPPYPAIIEEGRLILADGSPIFALAEGDGYDAARLLLPGQLHLLHERLDAVPLRLFLGYRELALCCVAEHEDAVAQLEQLIPREDGVPGQFLLEPSGRLLDLSP